MHPKSDFFTFANMFKQSFLLFLIVIATSCAEKYEVNVTDFAIPEMQNAAQPFLYSNGKSLYLSWQESRDSLNELKYSRLNDTSWATPETLARGQNWFINWADFPSLSVTKTNILSHYLPKSGGSTYAYDINVILTGADTTYKLHDDTVKGEHGFVSSVPYKDDKFFITWLDGRNASMEDHHHAGTMSIRAAIINSSGEKENDWLLDEKTCDCCQTSIANLDNGVIIAYRDRSGEEIRDISIRKYIDGYWTKRETIGNDNWIINGCPVNGPKVVTSGNKTVIAWYSGENDGTHVKMAISNDDAKTFSNPVLVSDKTLGRVDAAIDHLGNIWVSHISMETGSPELMASQYNENGSLLREVSISELDGSRNTGFPQMELFEKNLYFAWTTNSATSGIILKRYFIN